MEHLNIEDKTFAANVLYMIEDMRELVAEYQVREILSALSMLSAEIIVNAAPAEEQAEALDEFMTMMASIISGVQSHTSTSN